MNVGEIEGPTSDPSNRRSVAMTRLDAEPVLQYPFSKEQALDVEPAFLALHERGPVRVQLPYGEPCWLATRYDDVRIVHADKRFGKEMGVGRDVPRLHQRPAIDPSSLAMMDAPRQSDVGRPVIAAVAGPLQRAQLRELGFPVA